QLVRMNAGALAAELEPLLDAEAVLLVDHREPEALELDILLDQRVRADHDRRLRRLQLLLLAHAAAQPADLQAERREPFAELAIVLLGEDLGRRHYDRLPAGVDRGEAGDR